MMVTSSSDQAMTRRSPIFWQMVFPSNSALVQAAEKGQTIVRDGLIMGDQGIPHTVAYMPVLPEGGESPAVIAILVELEEIYSFQNSTLFNTIVVFVALTVFALAIIYVNIYRTMISPLNKLRIIAGVMTSGQYHERRTSQHDRRSWTVGNRLQYDGNCCSAA